MGLIETLKREFSFFTGNYRILVISWMMMDLAGEMPTPNFQFYVEALGGTAATLGLIGLARWLGLAFVSFPGGYLADKYGRRWLVSTMTFGMAAIQILFALAPSWHFLLLGTIMSSFCLIYQPALFAMFQDSLPKEQKGTASAIVELIHSTFNTPGPLIAGLLLYQFGLVTSMKIIYLIVGLCIFAAAVLRLKLNETMDNVEEMRFRYFLSSYPKAIKENFKVWKAVPRSMFWLFVAQTIFWFEVSHIEVINAIYARDVLGILENQWWLVFIPLSLTMIVFSYPIGKFIDRTKRKTPLLLGLATWCLMNILFVNGDLTTVIFSMCLLGISILLILSTTQALISDLVPPESRGKINGFTNFVGYIMSALGAFLGSFFYTTLFPQMPFYVNLILAIPLLIIFIFFITEPKKR